jgi:hypothetical protein
VGSEEEGRRLMASIKNLQTGEVFDGPDDAAIPVGYEKVGGAQTAPAEKGFLQRATENIGEALMQEPKSLLRAGRLMTGFDKPQSAEDYALMAIGGAPLIMAGGAGAGALVPSLPRLGPALGRIATAGGLAKVRGEDNLSAALEAGGAGMAEGAMAAVKPLARAATGLDFIQKRIGPALARTGHQGWFEQELAWLKSPDAVANPGVWLQRVRDVAGELRNLDRSGESSSVFLEQIARGAKMPVTGWRMPTVPTGISRAAQAVVSPAGRSAVDAAMSSDSAPPSMVIGAVGETPIGRLYSTARRFAP